MIVEYEKVRASGVERRLYGWDDVGKRPGGDLLLIGEGGVSGGQVVTPVNLPKYGLARRWAILPG
jgi:hypothetical protein